MHYGKFLFDEQFSMMKSNLQSSGLFIIDGRGVLRQITMNDLPVGRSVDETLRLLQAFQYTDKHGEGNTNENVFFLHLFQTVLSLSLSSLFLQFVQQVGIQDRILSFQILKKNSNILAKTMKTRRTDHLLTSSSPTQHRHLVLSQQ